MELGKLQQPSAGIDDIHHSIDVGDPDRVADIILSVSPCRSGTTVMLRVFSGVGIESHHQQLKNLLRWKFELVSNGWKIPRTPDRPIFLKETLGPHTHEESVFNPLANLLEAGYPPGKLRLLIYGRAPRQTWLSWRECWQGETPVKHLVEAYQTTDAIGQLARSLAIPVTTLVYEALRDHKAELVVQRMFASLALQVRDEVVTSAVTELPPLTSENRSIVFPSEPSAFDSWPFIGRAKTSHRLSYFRRDDEPLNRGEAAVIVSGGACEIYEAWRRQCQHDLGLVVERDADFDGEIDRHLRGTNPEESPVANDSSSGYDEGEGQVSG